MHFGFVKRTHNAIKELKVAFWKKPMRVDLYPLDTHEQLPNYPSHFTENLTLPFDASEDVPTLDSSFLSSLCSALCPL